MAKTQPKKGARIRRKAHIRKTVSGTSTRPRLSVYRSSKHIYAQLIDDVSGNTMMSVSSQLAGISGEGKVGVAKAVGVLLGIKGIAAGVEAVCFDRNGFLYHGRVKALADGAREAGLVF